MKILAVSIPNQHFFQWLGQLRESGHDFDVMWFDIHDDERFSDRISWVKQVKNWKRIWKFPFRHRLRALFPSLAHKIEKWNARDPALYFEKQILDFQPDIIHCFEMDLAGIPVLPTLEKYSEIPVVYSSWGTDILRLPSLENTTLQRRFLERSGFLITDCLRDRSIASAFGFNGRFLGVFPANGGIDYPENHILPMAQRDTIIVKGYDDGVGQAVKILEALASLPAQHHNLKIVVYAADAAVYRYIAPGDFSFDATTIYRRGQHLPNENILSMMGRSILHVASSTSDGMPNALLEAMGMGAFPIQSNPGGASAEVIRDGENGLLIRNPEDAAEIKELILSALTDTGRLEKATVTNRLELKQRCDRNTLRPSVAALYTIILEN